MPNFCGVDIKVASNFVRFNRQRAVLNEEETDYIYKSTEEILKKDNLRIVFVQNTEDTDIKKLAISRADTREEYMNWNTNASGQTVGFETIDTPDDPMLGQIINEEKQLLDAVVELTTAFGIGGIV
jgi:hypothetical protein